MICLHGFFYRWFFFARMLPYFYIYAIWISASSPFLKSDANLVVLWTLDPNSVFSILLFNGIQIIGDVWKTDIQYIRKTA